MTTKRQAKESPVRIFVKKDAEGKELTREVTSPGSEVSALYDGFVEKKATTKSTGTTSS